MVVMVNQEEVAGTRRRLSMENGTGYFATQFVQPATPLDADAKLVEQDASSLNRAHFHQVDQFQVFVGGGGKLGKSDAAPVTVQYAGAFTPYGPIVSGPDGIDYFTFRARVDPGIRHIPEGLRDRKQAPRRYAIAQPWTGSEHPPAPPDTPTIVPLLGPDADGMGAFMLCLDGESCWTEDDGHRRTARFALVVEGELTCSGRRLTRHGCIFAAPNEHLPRFSASGSADVLIMRFPDHAEMPTEN